MHLFVTSLASVVVLLLAGSVASNVTKSIDLKQSDQDKSVVQSTCQRLHTGESQILAIGRLHHGYLILTTDLFLFELPPEALNPSIKPPYQMLISESPKHMRSRFPESYPALEAIATRVITAAVGAIQSIDGDGTMVADSRGYLLFSYQKNDDQACLLVIDIHLDKALEGPCMNSEPTRLFVSPVPAPFLSLTTIIDEPGQPHVWSPFMVITLQPRMDDADDDDESEFNSTAMCTSMEKCNMVIIPYTIKDFQKEPPYDTMLADLTKVKINITLEGEGRFVAGFIQDSQTVYLFDDQLMVHSLTGGEVILATVFGKPFDTSPLANFIGCNVHFPRKFKVNPTTLLICVLVFVVVEFVICCGLFYAIQSINTAAIKKKKLGDDDRKSRKDKKKAKKKVVQKSSSSKSRASSSSVSVEKSKSKSKSSTSTSRSKSRQSRGGSKMGGTTSASVSRASTKASSKVAKAASNLLSKAVSKRRGSLIHGSTSTKSRASSKSNLSRGSSKHRHSKDGTASTSVSKRYSPSSSKTGKKEVAPQTSAVSKS